MAGKTRERGIFKIRLFPMKPVEYGFGPLQVFMLHHSKGFCSAFMMRLFCIAFIFALFGAGTTPGPFPKLGPVSPFPAVVAVAQANHIPLQTFDPPAATSGKINPGDSVTALVTLCQKGARRTQWLLYLQAVNPSPNEKPAGPGAPVILYSSCGNKFEFASSPAFVSMRSIGPFIEPGQEGRAPVLQDRSASFAVDQGTLGIGLDRAAAALYRMVQSGTQGGFKFRDTPFSEAETRESRILARTVHLTSGEERALSGMIPALLSYSDIAQQTGGLNDIFLRIVNIPSVWSVVWNVGVQTSMEVQSDRVAPADPAIWGLPPHASAYYFPMRLELNNDDAFNITLVVTAPRSPLLVCGGVVGLLAEKAGDKDTYLTLRIVSARSSRVKTASPSILDSKGK